jgi:hypothetical protein
MSEGLTREVGPACHSRRVAESLRAGKCPPDFAFDRFLPHRLRAASHFFWTPLSVAVRGAQWLEECGVRSVVDIGSGPGKFCVAGALASRCRFIGLEHRPECVMAARELARRFGVSDRVCFLEGTLGVRHVPKAQAYYFYNPFAENLFGPSERLDDEVPLCIDRFTRDVALAVDLLRAADVGTYVLTYNGLGGPLPDGYVQVRVTFDLPSVLRLWCKTGTSHGSATQ